MRSGRSATAGVRAVPVKRVLGAPARLGSGSPTLAADCETLFNQQIAAKNHSWEFGVDSPDIANRQGPF